MRYRGETDVDGSCIPWTEVASWTVNGSSLACYPTSRSKNRKNFDEAQKLTWKEIKCSYGFINQEAELLDLGDPYRIHFNTHCDHTEGYQRQPYC